MSIIKFNQKEAWMNNSSMRVCVILSLTLIVFASAPLLEAGIVLSGRIHSLGRTEIIRIIIDSYSTPEEIQKLKQYMGLGDVDNFYKVLRALDKGQMQMPQSQSTDQNRHFNVAVEQPTETGARILLITETRQAEPGKNVFLFFVAELNLDKNYNGNGRIHSVARIKFPSAGGIDLDSQVTVPNEITDLRRVK
jgi:hypothetical protein